MVRYKLQANIIITFFLYIELAVVMVLLMNHPLYKYQRIAKYCHGIANLMFYSHPLVIFLLSVISVLLDISITQTPKFFIICVTEAIVGYFFVRLDNQLLNRFV